MQTAKISVAICTYNREKYLPELFNSILKQTLTDSDFEILLINNNSPGNTKELFEAFQNENPKITCQYVLESNQGLSHARNRAIKEANAPLITFLDDDAFIDKNYLKVLVDSFENHPEIGAIGGPIDLHYENLVPSWENKYLNSLLGYFNRGSEMHYFPKSDYPRGSNMAFRTLVFEKAGIFDVQLGRIGNKMFGGEEKDIFQRIYAMNIQVLYQNEALVHHSVPTERTTRDFIQKQALGTGISERIRAKSTGFFYYTKRLIIEYIKWDASLVLWVYYLCKCQSSKGNMIVFFRFWVTKGLLFKYEDS